MVIIRQILAFLLMFFTTALHAQTNTIQTLIDQAVATGQTQVVIPPGTYNIPAFSRNGAHLSLSGLQNFTILAQGVTMICGLRGTAVNFSNCQNVELRGLTIDYNPLPFVQGTITAAAADWSWMDVRLHDGYPDEMPTGNRVEVYSRITRKMVKDVWTLFGTTVTPVGARTYRFIIGIGGYQGRVSVGDLITDELPVVNAHGIRINDSRGVILRDVTLYTAPVFAILESRGGPNQYLGVHVVLGPTPPGATEPRLKTSTADGIHSVSAVVGPVVENCVLENLGDDGVAIHGKFGTVLSGQGTLLTTNNFDGLAGDTIRVVRNDGTVAFDARIQSLTTSGTQKTLTLDQSITAQNGWVIEAVNRKGNGFIVRNNIIRNKRARGILVKAENGLIEGNTIEWMLEGGIVVSPELYWMESGYSRNLRILNNTLRHIWLNASHPGYQAGAISIEAKGDGNYFPAAGGHLNIEVGGNRFDSCLGVNLLATSITGLNIHDNQFTNTHTEQRDHSAGYSVDNGAVIWLQNCDQVSLANNWVSNFGGTRLVGTSNCNVVSGATDGLRIGAVPIQPSEARLLKGEAPVFHRQGSMPVFRILRGKVYRDFDTRGKLSFN